MNTFEKLGTPSAIFTYSDSEAGQQAEKFTTLSGLIKHIESFGYHGDSEGIVYSQINNDDEVAILCYDSKENGITWRAAI